MDKLNIAKKHFRKYGLSENVLGEIVALLPQDENATEETIIEQLQAYENIAKSFQAEAERRVKLTKDKYEAGKKESSTKKENEEVENPTLAMLEKINSRLDAMEKGQISANLNKVAIDKLKALNLSDKEVEAVMFGRSFETSEAVEEFVAKQGEYFEEISAQRTKDNAGNGFVPQSGAGQYSQKEIEQDIKEFNKHYS